MLSVLVYVTTDHVYFDSRVIGSSQLEVKLKSLGSNTLCGVCCTSQFSPLRAPRARCGLCLSGLAIVAMAFSRRIRNCSCRVQLCYKFMFCLENEIVHFYLVWRGFCTHFCKKCPYIIYLAGPRWRWRENYQPIEEANRLTFFPRWRRQQRFTTRRLTGWGNLHISIGATLPSHIFRTALYPISAESIL